MLKDLRYQGRSLMQEIKGDLSENAEYAAAKEAQGMLELRISKLEDIVTRSRILDESKLISHR